MRDRGLSVDVIFMPTSPSLVGKLGPYGFSEEDSDRIRWEYRQGGNPSEDAVAVTVPSDYRGYLQLIFGRRAERGERYYSTAPSVVVRGEPAAQLR